MNFLYFKNVFWSLKLFYLQELNVPEGDVEQLLVSLILDNRIQGHIDQVNRLLERGDRWTPSLVICQVSVLVYFCFSYSFKYLYGRSKGMKKYAAIEKWNTQLSSLYQTVSNRVCWLCCRRFGDFSRHLLCLMEFGMISEFAEDRWCSYKRMGDIIKKWKVWPLFEDVYSLHSYER